MPTPPWCKQAELDRRLAELRAANPATAERSRLELATGSRHHGYRAPRARLTKKDLLTLDELRARMPDLRAEERA